MVTRLLPLFCLLLVGCSYALEWPLPVPRTKGRTPEPGYCQAMVPFCPWGYTHGFDDMGEFAADDVVDVFWLQKPIFQFAYGDLMGKINAMHDAVGFTNRRTGMNYTMEWYELQEIANCTFPHVVNNNSVEELVWCNQGAACVYPGIRDHLWVSNGTIAHVGVVNGSVFNALAKWIEWDNNTAPIYETWTVTEAWPPAANETIATSHDCADFVQRVMAKLVEFGTTLQFNLRGDSKRQLSGPHYNHLVLLADNVEKLDPVADAEEILSFYELFQPHLGWKKTLEHVIEAVGGLVLLEHRFILYYGGEYYRLHLKEPFVKFVYELTPLPQ